MQETEDLALAQEEVTRLYVQERVIEIHFSSDEANKLNTRQEDARQMFQALSASSLRDMLDHIAWEIEAVLKLEYIKGIVEKNYAVNNNVNNKKIIVVDRHSSADWLYERMLESLSFDPALQGHIGMFDSAGDPEAQKSLVDSLRRQDNRGLTVLITASDAAQQGFLENIIDLKKPSLKYQIMFFDTLRNNPAAVVQFARLFKKSKQNDPLEVEFLKVIEPRISENFSFSA